MLLGSFAVLSVLSAVAVCWFRGGFSGLDWIWMLPVSFAASYLILIFLAFLFVWALCATVDTSKPQEHDSPFFRKMTYLYVDAIVKILRMRIHTEGLDMVPTGGRFLLVANHLFDFDPVVLYACFQGSQLAFISKRENTTMFVVGKLMHRLMCQLINRDNDREALRTILKCIQLIKEDEVSVAVFPEGYCSTTGRLQKFRAGAFKIATKTNVPIAVVTIQNTDKVLRNLLHLRHTDIHLHLVGVIQPEDYAGMTATQISDRAFGMMLSDLGPGYAPLPAPAEE